MIHQLTNKCFFCSRCIKCINKHCYSLGTHFLPLFPPSNGPHGHVPFLHILKCKVSFPVLSVLLSVFLSISVSLPLSLLFSSPLSLFLPITKHHIICLLRGQNSTLVELFAHIPFLIHDL